MNRLIIHIRRNRLGLRGATSNRVPICLLLVHNVVLETGHHTTFVECCDGVGSKDTA
jgi:hypothetical protein